MSPEEKYQKICQSAGLTHFQNHPLFSRSVAAGINEYYADVLHKTQKNLNKRGFTAIVCAKASEVEGTVSKLFANSVLRNIGFGNSQTTRLCGLVEWAEAVAENVYQHDPRNFSAEDDRQALFSDAYFSSANAVSEKGHIINIDGTGNRVSATCFGPKEVIYVVGRNKVSPTLETAVDRAKHAAVHLATFYQRNTPCAQTGRCHDCLSPECVCGVTTVHRKALIGNSITVILVNEDLGL
ncbi:lactate utilization protein [Ruminococcaceae bacterium OttesenSCG-928-L11]|nr:lactate utilization protein [Ruminococcaceae bacterium OttesenSCG-928-L11]